MRGLAAFALILTFLGGCASAPVVYAPDDKPGTDGTGTVASLQSLLIPGLPVRVVFVHGVGDHCYGYALGRDGWLNNNATDALGLRETRPLSEPKKVFASVFMGGAPDPNKYVEVGTRGFEATIPGASGETHVEAVEITWSHMTQWIKSNQLSYDSTEADFGVLSSEAATCLDGPDASIPASKAPPPRLFLDKTIKETVFDRNLADAILYAGSYGKAMELAVADGLCRSISSETPDNQRCMWPSAEKARAYNWIFVTHSLGSRLVYDTVLHLIGFDTETRTNPLPADDPNSRTFAGSMLANTAAFYMMANHLSLLGLANVPPGSRSDDGPHPFAAPRLHCGNVIAAIADARSRVAEQQSSTVRLQVVAFNDTNDLLTWHIPKWYANAAATEIDCRPQVDLVNVFVQNDTHWLVIESPAPAHSNYFRKRAVWNINSCGATRGKVSC